MADTFLLPSLRFPRVEASAMKRVSLCTLAVALSVAACSSDRNPQPGGGNKDAMTTEADGAMQNADGGMQMTGDTGMAPVDTGVPATDSGVPATDSGVPATDGGTPLVCNPFDGSGCMAPNICIFVPNTRMSQCRMPAAAPKTFEQACDGALQDCGAGLTCIQFNGEAMPTCRKTCDPANQGAGCAGLMGASTTGYACIGGVQGVTDVAICAPAPTSCVPYNDMCPMNQNCEAISMTMTGCVPAGPTANGAACTPQALCATGNCLNIGSGAKCWEPCNPAAPACSANGTCLSLQGLSFGICSPTCDVFTNTCPQSDNCELTSQTGTGCVPAGMGAAGAACTQSCARGALCVNQVCRTPCDAGHACATGMCNMLQGLTFGVCI